MRLSYIQALKGVAIGGVVWFHSSSFSVTPTPEHLQPILSLGARGVQLFFVLSAISLSYSWFLKPVSINRFYWNRFKKIAPAYYLALIYWQFITPIPVVQLILSLLFVNYWSPFMINSAFPGSWFVPVIFFFYLIFPLMVNLIKRISSGVMVTVMALLICQFIRMYMLANPLISNTSLWSEFTFLFPLSQLPVFWMGLLTYRVIVHRKWVKKEIWWLLLVMPFTLVSGHYVYGLLFCILTIVLSRKPISLLVNRITVSLGEMSYVIYLTHMIVLYWLVRFNLFEIEPTFFLGSYVIRFFAVLSLSYSLSRLLHRILKFKYISPLFSEL